MANHMEPVQGLIQRFLRRRLIQSELKNKACDRELEQIIDWIPRCWAHINKFLETHNSTVVTIGPRWFLNMPVDSTCSQVWFTDLWNYTLGPYLLHAAKEGLELYGKRASWEDPVQWVMSTYPWPHGSAYDTLMRFHLLHHANTNNTVYYTKPTIYFLDYDRKMLDITLQPNPSLLTVWNKIKILW